MGLVRLWQHGPETYSPLVVHRAWPTSLASFPPDSYSIPITRRITPTSASCSYATRIAQCTQSTERAERADGPTSNRTHPPLLIPTQSVLTLPFPTQGRYVR